MIVTIGKGQVCFGTIPLAIGESFDKVCGLLGMHIYTKQYPNSEGRGYIIVNDIDFYDLKGKATLYFVEGCLLQISFSPEWSKYDLDDENGNRPPIDLVVNKIAKISNEALQKTFGEPVERSKYGGCLYRADRMAIISSITRSEDGYSVMVKSTKREG